MNQALTLAFIAVLALGSVSPTMAAKLVDAPPPPPIPDAQLEEDGTPRKPFVMENVSRGQILFENHCLACHESRVHIRTDRKVKSLPALQAMVIRWSVTANLPWGKEEIEEVVRYLNHKYYHF